MRSILVLANLCIFPLCARMHVYTNHLSDKELREQLDSAHIKFHKAKKMFNPWYSGPLLAGSAHILPPGAINTQPYLFFTTNYGSYTARRHHKKEDNTFILNPENVLQIGILPKLQFTLVNSAVYQTQNGIHSGGYGDTQISLGLEIFKEEAYLPAIAFYVAESFPTGKFERGNGSKSGLDLTGNGAFVTSVQVTSSKVVWWVFEHPMQIRLNFTSDIYSSKIPVKGINAYGGYHDTKGTVTKGNTMQWNFSYEGSITQNWVVAVDVVYEYNNNSTFKGMAGVDSNGMEAVVGNASSDVLSIAPAIEYNIDENSGLLVGFWMSVYGRNTAQFASGVLTYQITF